MDTTITSAPAESAGAAVTEAVPTQTGPVGSGTELGTDTASQSDASGEQSTADNTQQTRTEKRWSKVDEIKELRSQRREHRQQLEQLRSELEEMRAWREQQQANAQAGRKTERNPAEFWQDPEARLEALMEEKLARLEEGLSGRFQQSREQYEAEQALRQEQQAGVEFIRSQSGYSPEDDEELIDIIEDNGLASLGPTKAAEFAWMMLQKSRGVSDKSSLKRKAAGIQGQPPGVGLGEKIWSRAEFDATVNALEKQGAKADQKLLEELLSAHKDGRVR